MIRWASLDDAPSLADVHVTTWQKAYAGILEADFLAGLDRERRARWWRGIVDAGARVHVVDVEGKVVGFCYAGDSDDAGWGEIYAIYVLPEHWGEGYGRELLTAGKESLAADGHDCALLWVLEGNDRARRFYERQGWTIGKPIRVEEIGGFQVTEVRYETNLAE